VTFTALFASELRRLTTRRAVRVGLAVALGIVAAFVVVTAVRSTGIGPTDHTMRLVTLWLDGPDGTRENAVLAIGTYLDVLVVGIAATAVGADFRAGTVGTLLTWEPRRVRVAAARIAATVVVAVVLYLVVIAVFSSGWWLGAAMRGSTAGTGGDFVPNLLAAIARGAAGAGLLAALTAGLAFVARGTVGALMIWFVYLIGIEAILANRVTGLHASLLLANLGAFLQGTDLFVLSSFGEVRHFTRPGDGLIRTLVILAVVVALGVLTFRRRDVT
jgi:ABC-2 type transport system permease protein